MEVNSWLASTGLGTGVPGEVGLNVTTRPFRSVAVHCDVDGQATADKGLPPPVSTAIGSDQVRATPATA